MKKEEEDHNFSRKRAFPPLTKRVLGTAFALLWWVVFFLLGLGRDV